MPLWRYAANRFLTFAQNILMHAKLSEFHTGYRGFTREVLETLPLEANSNDFVFDSQMLAQILWCGFAIGEVSCPTRYAPDGSSISFRRAVKYGFGCLSTALEFRLARWGLVGSRRFPGTLIGAGPRARTDPAKMSGISMAGDSAYAERPAGLHGHGVELAPLQAELVTVPACPVCGAGRARPTYAMRGFDFELVTCEACGLGRLHPQPTAEVLSTFYPNEYYGSGGRKFSRLVEPVIRRFGERQARAMVQDVAAGGRVLDVGCGPGCCSRISRIVGWRRTEWR